AGFLTVSALQRGSLPAGDVGRFTTLLLAGSMIGTLALGWVADRAGHRLAILAGMAAMVGANLVALAAPSSSAFGAAFVLTGVHVAAVNVSNLNVMLEFAPAPEERPTYIGLGTTSMAPVALGAPLAAGLTADAAGFVAVFAVAAVAGAGGLAVLLARVRDPRHARALTPAAEPGR
ncbi:MAG TPA: MFS transporter, partial [Methylomirabilota bacterium]|nr:MFS transporter [Methylomirabilota bacterium]